MIARAFGRLVAKLFGLAPGSSKATEGEHSQPPLFTIEVREIPEVRPPEPTRQTIATPPSAFTVEVMRESYYKHIIAGLIGDAAPPDGIVKAARCVPEPDGSVRVEIDGAMVGYLYSKYWWHYAMTMNGAAASCRANITGRLTPGHDHPERFDVMLDLALPALDPEIAAHQARSYECEVMGDSKCQPALREIFRGRAATKPAAWVPLVTAQLVPEDTDPAGVRVQIEGQTVGYLGKLNARKYRETPDAPKTAPAIIGETQGSDGRKKYAVRLSLPVR